MVEVSKLVGLLLILVGVVVWSYYTLWVFYMPYALPDDPLQ